MLSITHIVVTLLLIQLLTLDRNDAFIAMLFGVFIDADHLFGLMKYTQANGVASMFDLDTLMNPGGQWKSILHSPIAAAVVAPLSFAVRLSIPILFWAVHLLMDFFEQNFLGHFSELEAGLFLFATLSLLTLRYGQYIMNNESSDFRDYFRVEVEGLRGLFRGKPETSF